MESDYKGMLTEARRDLAGLEKQRQQLQAVIGWLEEKAGHSSPVDDVEHPPTKITMADAVRKIMYASEGRPMLLSEIQDAAQKFFGGTFPAKNPYNTIAATLSRTEGVIKVGRSTWRFIEAQPSLPNHFVSKPDIVRGQIQTLERGR